MTWKLRHEGSPNVTEDLTIEQVFEGLQDGRWEPTDEVIGPADLDWVRLEDHFLLSEFVADAEPPFRARPEDETRLDMTALIDVTLVLLIFFILTAGYQALEKILEMPTYQKEDPSAIRIVRPDEVKQFMIHVKVRQEGSAPAIWVEGRRVNEDALLKELKRYAREDRNKTELFLDAEGVDYGTVVKIIDAAQGAKISKVNCKAGAGVR